ncbi:hypothetical protein AB2B38_013645 [Balneola sp. MJW-20]|uniref:hypothetical protein n=1 Tax=Gracilimonas aurantiaca TaxID=3234185 RepID=UPI003465CBEB
MGSYKKIIIPVCIIFFMMTGCIWIFKSVEVDNKKPIGQTESPFKAYLKDGSIALFQDGATFGEYIVGRGEIYGPDLQFYSNVDRLDVNKVAAYSVFNEETNEGTTVGVSLLATAGTIAATPFLLVAIFGSCPTVYTVEGEPVLRGELFSNSIAPMLEARDLISLGVEKADDQYLRLEIRNEALETHYMNHLELIEVKHEEGSIALPTSRNMVLSLKDFIDPVKAKTKSGSDIKDLLSSYDPESKSEAYTFDGWTTEDYGQEPAWDYIDLVFPPSEGNTALHLNLKNSLFSTVLLYDYYLSGQGINAINWLSKDLATVSEAVALGGFHNKYMGLRVHQHLGGEYQQIVRIPDVGPVSWKDLAVPLESSGDDSVRVRLSFLADSWTFKNARLATSVTEPEINTIPVSRVLDADNNDLSLVTKIQAADDNYLISYPGQRYFVEYELNGSEDESKISYLLSGQGYYTEWIREDWIKETRFPDGIEYNSDLIVDAQNRWRQVKPDLSKRFFNSKVPVQ